MNHVIKLKDGEEPPAGYVLAVRNEGPLAGRYAVQPRTTCGDCHGRGVVYTTKARVKPAGGLGQLEATTERVLHLCGCVGGRLYRALDAGGSNTLGGPPAVEPMITPPDPAARWAGRVARLRDEVAKAEARAAEAVAARDAATAPHLARKAAAEHAAEDRKLKVAVARAFVDAVEADLLMAATALAEATTRHVEAQARAEAATATLHAAEDALAPLAMEIEAAATAAATAANRGHRHRIQVAQERLAELRARLARVEAEAPAAPAAAEVAP
jgi:hypothetical protein